MDEVIISLSSEELNTLKLLVKERIAVWHVRVESAPDDFTADHNKFQLEYYKSLLKSLEVSL